MNDLSKVEIIEHLPSLVDRASKALTSARSAAEVLEARELASVAYDAAKRAGRLAKAKDAHDTLIQAAYRAQGDAIMIEAQAKARLADEYDAAQERGEVARPADSLKRGPVVPDENNGKAHISEIGLTRKQVHEARQVRDAEKNDPGVVARTVGDLMTRGREPTKAEVRESIIAAAESGGKRKKRPSNKNPNYKPDPQHDAFLRAASLYDFLTDRGARSAEYIAGGARDYNRDRGRQDIERCRDFLTEIMERMDA